MGVHGVGNSTPSKMGCTIADTGAPTPSMDAWSNTIAAPVAEKTSLSGYGNRYGLTLFNTDLIQH